MASNSFGRIFRVTTFGESHGKAIGVVIDGCPSGISLKQEEIQIELNRRRPGFSRHTSPRREEDQVEILSGIFEGTTTGAPIALLIGNKDADSSKYEPIKHLLRPGHANYSYLQKYGIFDHRGGGRASGRETVARVAAGAIAKKVALPMEVRAWVSSIAGETDKDAIERILDQVIEDGDSLGGVVTLEIHNAPPGLGDPIYEKLEARLALAMLSIPATKGIEFGKGFEAARMKGSDHNDGYTAQGFTGNSHGGILGGISTGEPITARIAFKPTSSIKKAQKSVNYETGEEEVFMLPEGSRHDPCIALRAPAIVESMAALVMADALLSNRCSKIS